ncbi:uncharacterized protein LOC144359465 [Saccoglossus kowalevskii]
MEQGRIAVMCIVIIFCIHGASVDASVISSAADNRYDHADRLRGHILKTNTADVRKRKNNNIDVLANSVDDYGSAYQASNDDIETKVAELESRLKDLNIHVLTNAVTFLEAQQSNGDLSRDTKSVLEQHARRIKNVSSSIHRLERLLSQHSNTQVLGQLKDQTRILENLTETIKDAVIRSTGNADDIKHMKKVNTNFYNLTIRRLKEQGRLLNLIQDDLTELQDEDEDNEDDREDIRDMWSEFLQVRSGMVRSMTNVQQRVSGVEKLVSDIGADLNGINHDIESSVKKNIDDIYEQSVDLIHLNYDVHRIEENLQELADDSERTMNEMQLGLDELRITSASQSTQMVILDEKVVELQEICCGENMDVLRGDVVRINDNLQQFRSTTNTYLDDISDDIKQSKSSIVDLKHGQEEFDSLVARIQDEVSLESMKRERAEKHCTEQWKAVQADVTSVRDKGTFDVSGLKASINVLLDRHSELSNDYTTARTRIELLERHNGELEDEIGEIQDAILKLTNSIQQSAETNRHFLQGLIQDLMGSDKRNN